MHARRRAPEYRAAGVHHDLDPRDRNLLEGPEPITRRADGTVITHDAPDRAPAPARGDDLGPIDLLCTAVVQRGGARLHRVCVTDRVAPDVHLVVGVCLAVGAAAMRVGHHVA